MSVMHLQATSDKAVSMVETDKAKCIEKVFRKFTGYLNRCCVDAEGPFICVSMLCKPVSPVAIAAQLFLGQEVFPEMCSFR